MFILYNLVVNKNQYGSNRMTTILDGLLKEDNILSIIKDYINFVGDLDYFGEAANEPGSTIITITANIPGENPVNFSFDYRDNLMFAASTVNTLKNQKDPSIILLNPDGSKTFYIKKGAYTSFDVYSNTGDTEEQINKANNIKRHFTLGNYIKSKQDSTLESFNNLDENTLKIISQLIKE